MRATRQDLAASVLIEEIRMSIALGIDTGGTYTDAALVEYGSNRVVASARQ